MRFRPIDIDFFLSYFIAILISSRHKTLSVKKSVVSLPCYSRREFDPAKMTGGWGGGGCVFFYWMAKREKAAEPYDACDITRVCRWAIFPGVKCDVRRTLPRCPTSALLSNILRGI